jgi:hypothetical protein
VLVVPVIAAGVVVLCGGLLLWSVGHGRGGDALYMLLCPIEDRGETDGGLFSGVVLRVQLGDGYVVYVLGLLSVVIGACVGCTCDSGRCGRPVRWVAVVECGA